MRREEEELAKMKKLAEEQLLKDKEAKAQVILDHMEALGLEPELLSQLHQKRKTTNSSISFETAGEPSQPEVAPEPALSQGSGNKKQKLSTDAEEWEEVVEEPLEEAKACWTASVGFISLLYVFSFHLGFLLPEQDSAFKLQP